MDVEFLGQPFNEEAQLGRALMEALQNRPGGQFLAITAWAKKSGLARLKDSLGAFRDAGGSTEIILGVDEAGATWQGLELALELFDVTRVFHDSGNRTFHPKVYLIEDGDNGLGSFLAVGSSNATRGGLFMNYEAGLVVRFDPHTLEGDHLRSQIIDYYERLVSAFPACREIDPHILNGWRENGPPVPIVDEGIWHPHAPAAGADDSEQGGPDDDGGVPPAQSEFFGTPVHGLAGAPPLPITEVGQPEYEDDTDSLPTPEPEAESEAVVAAPAPHVARRWTKQLAGSDAQRPPSADSNPTGNLRLTKSGHDIDWKVFFRQDLFATADWQPRTDRYGNATEVAEIDFDVHVLGEGIGTRTLEVDHAPHRESGQANHVTLLHWGPLAERLRQEEDHQGNYVSIERLDDGSYRLRFTQDDPGAIL